MMKYLIGLGGLVVVVVGGYILLVPEETSQQAPSVPLAVETETTPADDPAPASDPAPDAETVLEDMAADARENLPEDLTDTVTLTDALFLPRMRIMEYSYVTSAPDARASAQEMRTLIEARAETICLDGREMFDMGVTLRHSFEDSSGIVFQRVYLLPEQCQRFY